MTQALYGIYGASGCGRGVMPLVRAQLQARDVELNRLVFVDDNCAAPIVNGQRVLTYKQFIGESVSGERYITLAIANGKIRQSLARQCSDDGVKFLQARAENVTELDDVLIAEGAVLSPFVVLTSNIRIGRHFHANLYSYVEHDCVIGDYVTFAPGVKCNGNVVIGDHAYIGAGAVIKQGLPGKPLVIGASAVIGMGAVVTKDVPAGITVVGNPARVISP